MPAPLPGGSVVRHGQGGSGQIDADRNDELRQPFAQLDVADDPKDVGHAVGSATRDTTRPTRESVRGPMGRGVHGHVPPLQLLDPGDQLGDCSVSLREPAVWLGKRGLRLRHARLGRLRQVRLRLLGRAWSVPSSVRFAPDRAIPCDRFVDKDAA